MRKSDFASAKTKAQISQLRSNCAAHQRLCFRYTDSKIPLLPNGLGANKRYAG